MSQRDFANFPNIATTSSSIMHHENDYDNGMNDYIIQMMPITSFLSCFNNVIDTNDEYDQQITTFHIDWIAVVLHICSLSELYLVQMAKNTKHFNLVSSLYTLLDAIIMSHPEFHKDMLILYKSKSKNYHIYRKLLPHITSCIISITYNDLETIIHSQTLPIKDCRIFEAGFFAPLATVKKPLTHILSKVINIRCQARKFSTVLRKYMHTIQSNKRLSGNQQAETKMNDDHPVVICQTLKTLFICSLLGNYSHVETCYKANIAARITLYQCLHRKQTSQWFLNMLEHCSILIINALRDYLIFAIGCHQELERRLDVLMHLTEFRNIVDKNMSFVRNYVNQTLRLPTSSFSRSLHQSKNTLDFNTMTRDLNQLMHQSHSAILAISYRRPNLPFYQFLLSCRKRGFLIEIPHGRLNRQTTNRNQLTITGNKRKRKHPLAFHEPISKSENEVCDEDDEKQSDVKKIKTESSQNLEVKKAVKKDIEDEFDIDNEDDCGIRNLFDFITQQQYDLLHLLVMNHNPYSQNVITEILPYFESFGINQHTIRFITHQIFLYNHNGSSTEQIKTQIFQLRSNQPHAYNLLQIVAEIIRQKHRHFTIYDLPVHITKNQLNAAQNRYEPFIQESAVLHNFLHFVYCRICGAIYSLLRDYNAVYKRLYKYGLRDVVSSYLDDSIYCGRDRVSHLGECQTTPLQKIPLLGQIISYHGKQILLCPQPKCCKPMVYHIEHMIFNEYGPMCKDCIDYLVESNVEYKALQHKYRPEEFKESQPTSITCDLCGIVMEKQSKMHCFIRDIHICKNHRLSFFAKQISDAVKNNPHYTRDDFIAGYSKFIKDRFEFKQAVMKDFHARQASKASLKARSKRR